MPDDPIQGSGAPGDDPQERLRRLIDEIESEERRIGSTMRQEETEPRSNIDEQELGGSDEFLLPAIEDEGGENLSPEEIRLRELEQEISEARARSMPEPPEWQYQRPKIPGKFEGDERGYLGLGVGLSVAYTIIGATVIGWGIGKLIDMRAGGYVGQALGTLIGAIAGLGGAIFTIVRAQDKQNR